MTPLLALAVLLGPARRAGLDLRRRRAGRACRRRASRGRCCAPRRPSVTADRIESGGLFLGAPALFGVHGASWTDTTWQLGDIDVTDPDRGGHAA